MSRVGDYRIRWANVSHCNGYRQIRQRMCIGERMVSFLGFKFWFPFQGSEWRWSEDEAMQDVERDRYLHSPLPEPKIIA